MPSCRATRSKGDPISQKTAVAIHPSPDDRQISQYLAAKNGLTRKILPHILPPRKRKFFINYQSIKTNTFKFSGIILNPIKERNHRVTTLVEINKANTGGVRGAPHSGMTSEYVP
jgi:hypothetical protein